MNKFVATILAAALSGCLGSAPKAPVNWTIDVDAEAKASFVAVCAPYGGQRIAVLRPDGSIAFDPGNSFAASPSAILKDALVARGGKGAVLVRRLALDCRTAGKRDALVELELAVGDRSARGAASVPTPDGNFSAAFSSAFSRAYAQAQKGLEPAQ